MNSFLTISPLLLVSNFARLNLSLYGNMDKTACHKNDKIGILKVLHHMAVSKTTHGFHNSDTPVSNAWVRDTEKKVQFTVHFHYNARKSRYRRNARGEINKQTEVNNKQAKTPGKKETNKRQSPQDATGQKTGTICFMLFWFFKSLKALVAQQTIWQKVRVQLYYGDKGEYEGVRNQGWIYYRADGICWISNDRAASEDGKGQIAKWMTD